MAELSVTNNEVSAKIDTAPAKNEPGQRARNLFLELYPNVPAVSTVSEHQYGSIHGIDPLEGGIFLKRLDALLYIVRETYNSGQLNLGENTLTKESLNEKLGCSDISQAADAIRRFMEETLKTDVNTPRNVNDGQKRVAAVFEKYNVDGDFKNLIIGIREEEHGFIQDISIGDGKPENIRKFLNVFYFEQLNPDPNKVYYREDYDRQFKDSTNYAQEHEGSHFDFMQQAAAAIKRPDLSPNMSLQLVLGEDGILTIHPACSDARFYMELLAGNITEEDFNTYRKIAYQNPHHGKSEGDEIMLDVMSGAQSPENQT